MDYGKILAQDQLASGSGQSLFYTVPTPLTVDAAKTQTLLVGLTFCESAGTPAVAKGKLYVVPDGTTPATSAHCIANTFDIAVVASGTKILDLSIPISGDDGSGNPTAVFIETTTGTATWTLFGYEVTNE